LIRAAARVGLFLIFFLRDRSCCERDEESRSARSRSFRIRKKSQRSEIRNQQFRYARPM